MTEIHSCSYYCERPECVKAQRDELRERLAQPEQEPVAYYHPHKGFYWAKPTRISAPTAVDVKPLPLYTAPPQPEQEPVAYAVYHRMGGGKSLHWPEQHSLNGDANAYQLAPLYTAPPQRKPLTVEEIKKLIHPIVMADLSDLWGPVAREMTDFEIVRAIEAAHGIKENT